MTIEPTIQSTQAPVIHSKDDLISRYTEFCEDIKQSGFRTAPTGTAFAAWLMARSDGTLDRRAVNRVIRRYASAAKAELDTILSDTVAEGMLLGKYPLTAAVFCLKNWCGWADKQEVRSESSVSVSETAAEVERMVADAEK